MTKIEEEKFEDHDELIFPCDAGDDHFLRIAWDDNDTDWRFLWITSEWRPERLRDRIKDAFKILRGKEYCYQEIVLNDVTVASLKKFLEDK